MPVINWLDKKASYFRRSIWCLHCELPVNSCPKLIKLIQNLLILKAEFEKREKLLQLLEDYEITIDRDDPTRDQLRFASNDRELARKIVKSAFSATNEELRRDNLFGIANLQSSIESSLNFEIDEVERTISNAIANYEINTAARVADLAEHAAIARQLGISDNQAVIETRGTSGVGINVNTNLPLYLRGYHALEKEVALIKARGTGKDILLYIPNYPKLAQIFVRLKTIIVWNASKKCN